MTGSDPRILVLSASKHGSTTEVGEFLTHKLVELGFDAVTMPISEVEVLTGWDAVVLGSAVYKMGWLPEAVEFLSRFESDLAKVSLWLFSLAMNGVSRGGAECPSRMDKVWSAFSVAGNATFAGRIDLSQLSLFERSIISMVGSPEGDFRDWEKVAAFALSISNHLNERYPVRLNNC